MENSGFKPIATGLYGGSSIFSKAKTAYELEVVSCCNSENCPLFKQKKCIMASRINRLNWLSADAKCPYSQISNRIGKSSRSKDYFVLKYEYQNSQYYKQIQELGVTPAQSIMYFEVGDYAYIKLSSLGCKIVSNNDTKALRVISSAWDSFCRDDESRFLSASGFIEKSLLTVDLFKQIFKVAENRNYLKEIEDLKTDILKYQPNLAKELGIETPNYIGRKAQLLTLTPPFEFKKENTTYYFTEDKLVTSVDPKIINNFLIDNAWKTYIGELLDVKAIFKPKEDVYIEVTDNSWVNDNTIFK